MEETDTKYRRIPTIAEAFSYLYNTTIQISGDVEEIVRRHISELQEQINNIRTEIENIKQDFLNRIEIENLAKRDMTMTEWNEFRRPDFDKIKILLKSPVIFDGRNQYNAERLKEKGFEYYQIGVGK